MYYVIYALCLGAGRGGGLCETPTEEELSIVSCKANDFQRSLDLKQRYITYVWTLHNGDKRDEGFKDYEYS